MRIHVDPDPKHCEQCTTICLTLNLTLSAFFFILTLLASFRLAFNRKSLISLISRGIFASITQSRIITQHWTKNEKMQVVRNISGTSQATSLGKNLSNFNYSYWYIPFKKVRSWKRTVSIQIWIPKNGWRVDLSILIYSILDYFSLIANRAADDFNIIDGSIVVVCLDKADIFDRVHSRMNPSEDGVLPVQPLKNITMVLSYIKGTISRAVFLMTYMDRYSPEEASQLVFKFFRCPSEFSEPFTSEFKRRFYSSTHRLLLSNVKIYSK